ncbi:MAG: hypothetical protein ACTSXP_06015 [Promethearchaeota archaeon]
MNGALELIKFVYESFWLLVRFLLDPKTILLINLPLTTIAIFIFIYGFYLNYFKVRSATILLEEIDRIPKRDKYFLALQFFVLIIVGIINIFVTLFISILFINISIGYFKNIIDRKAETRVIKKINIITLVRLLIAIYFVAGFFLGMQYGFYPILNTLNSSITPTIGGGIYEKMSNASLIFGGITALLVCLVSIGFYRIWGKKIKDLSFHEFMNTYSWRVFQRIPSTFRFFMTFIIIIVPLCVLLLFFYLGFDILHVGLNILKFLLDFKKNIVVSFGIMIYSRILFNLTMIYCRKKLYFINYFRKKKLEHTPRYYRIVIFFTREFSMVLIGSLSLYISLVINFYSLIKLSQFMKPIRIFKKYYKRAVISQILLYGQAFFIQIIIFSIKKLPIIAFPPYVIVDVAIFYNLRKDPLFPVALIKTSDKILDLIEKKVPTAKIFAVYLVFISIFLIPGIISMSNKQNMLISIHGGNIHDASINSINGDDLSLDGLSFDGLTVNNSEARDISAELIELNDISLQNCSIGETQMFGINLDTVYFDNIYFDNLALDLNVVFNLTFQNAIIDSFSVDRMSLDHGNVKLIYLNNTEVNSLAINNISFDSVTLDEITLDRFSIDDIQLHGTRISDVIVDDVKIENVQDDELDLENFVFEGLCVKELYFESPSIEFLTMSNFTVSNLVLNALNFEMWNLTGIQVLGIMIDELNLQNLTLYDISVDNISTETSLFGLGTEFEDITIQNATFDSVILRDVYLESAAIPSGFILKILGETLFLEYGNTSNLSLHEGYLNSFYLSDSSIQTITVGTRIHTF